MSFKILKTNAVKGEIIKTFQPMKCSTECILFGEFCNKSKYQYKVCRLETAYLAAMEEKWLPIWPKLNDYQRDGFRLVLVPLYQQYIRFQKETYALSRVTYKDKKGGIKSYPHFKELRAITKAISDELKELDVKELWQKEKKVEDLENPNFKTDEAELENGMVGYYEQLLIQDKSKEKGKGKGKGKEEAGEGEGETKKEGRKKDSSVTQKEKLYGEDEKDLFSGFDDDYEDDEEGEEFEE